MQIVANKAQHKTIMERMKEEADRCGSSNRIALKAVTKFPATFHVYDQESRKNYLKKAYR